jgi:putative hydrolase of the HAD superfamily
MKAILFDADGVILKDHGYFSERFSKERGVPPEKIKEELTPYLAEWEWNEGVDAFLAYWFSSDTHPDDELFAKVATLRARGIPCYLASNQEKYRASFLIERLGLNAKLDGCFFSSDLGVMKSQPEYFQAVLARIHTLPEETGYLDDDQKNIDAAAKVGIRARLYRKIGDLEILLAENL